ncbi:helix-turn-helix domain-containing protein [Ereboglobus luteus]|uniref:HTH iclR-type domain-containing protein n=1 Tax=Ereboglobus luteus TaxID=1796921 RepID=A0A2U8E4S2_9BACT|nr:hypothetical protein CKA38_11860 [Ereboglobus luteus]
MKSNKGKRSEKKTSSSIPPHTVPVLLKALRIFESVARGEAETPKELAAALGVSPTTCYRILQSFRVAGWLQPGAGGRLHCPTGSRR